MTVYIYTLENEFRLAALCKQDKPEMVEHIVEAESLLEAIDKFEKEK